LELEGLRAYLNDLASASPAPGGGAAAAVTVAQGLALLSMVCNLTIGKKKFKSVESQAIRILERVSAMSQEALSEAESDVNAFRDVMKAYRMPADTEEQRSAKQAAVEKATRGAAEPPFRLMRLAAAALPLADELEKIANLNVLSDVHIARHLLKAGYKSSQENVEVNLEGLSSSDPFIKEMRNKIGALVKGR
jgi:methenyltetrahydrofolate cyclohydrolase